MHRTNFSPQPGKFRSAYMSSPSCLAPAAVEKTGAGVSVTSNPAAAFGASKPGGAAGVGLT